MSYGSLLPVSLASGGGGLPAVRLASHSESGVGPRGVRAAPGLTATSRKQGAWVGLNIGLAQPAATGPWLPRRAAFTTASANRATASAD